MARRAGQSGEAERVAADRDLSELGRALTAPAAAESAAAGGAAPEPAGDMAAEVELSLADLISDGNGEVVFFNDSGFRSLGITTEASVVANGEATPHLTASGADVTGFQYVTFDNGLTLYYEHGLDLVVHHGGS